MVIARSVDEWLREVFFPQIEESKANGVTTLQWFIDCDKYDIDY